MKKVFISAGHGGSDPGACANGFKEKDLNLSIATHCANYLRTYGVNVLMSRTGDEEDGINDEARESNAFGADLTVSIHNNAGGGDGVEAFYHYGGGTSKVLAEAILSEIVAIGQNSRGAKTRRGSDGRDYYGFIRMTEAPAVIVECAFVDNANDVQIVATEEKRKIMGEAIAKGILKTLGIALVEPIPEAPKEEPPAENTPPTAQDTPPDEIKEEPKEEPTEETNPQESEEKSLWRRFLEALMELIRYLLEKGGEGK